MADVRELGLGRDILEAAVAPVVEEDVASIRTGDVEVLVAVVVVVGEGGGYADAVAQSNTRLLGDVGEGAVAPVFVQSVLAQLVAEVQVVAAIAVEVADRHAAAVIVQIEFEMPALFGLQKRHAKGDAGFPRTFPEAGRITFLADRDLSRVLLSPRFPDSVRGPVEEDRAGEHHERAGRDESNRFRIR